MGESSSFLFLFLGNLNMYTLYSKDGDKVTVKTLTNKKEYIASGFYFETPVGAMASGQEIEEAEFIDTPEIDEEDELREKYFQLFGKRAGNKKIENIKAEIESAESED